MSYHLDIKNIKPLGSNVLVVFENKEEQDYVLGDIILPESSNAFNSRYTKAKVLAIGEGKLLDCGKHEHVNVSVGDYVLVDDLMGSEVIVDGQTYHIVSFSDIIAVVLE